MLENMLKWNQPDWRQ